MGNSDTDDVCRICLKHGKPMTSVFEFHDSLQYSHKIMHCARIQISELESLPSVICKACQTDLTIAYDFVIKCQNSDDDLRKHLNYHIKSDEDCDLQIKYENEDNDTEFLDESPEEEKNPESSVKDKRRSAAKRGSNSNSESQNKNLGKEFLRVPVIKNELMPTSKVYSLEFEYDKPKENTGDTVIKKEHQESSFQHVEVSKIVKNKIPIETKAKETRPSVAKCDVTCKICGLHASCVSALISHTRTHTGEKPFRCPTCGLCFSQNGTLKMHIKRRHLGDKQRRGGDYTCEKCGKVFAKKGNFKTHLRMHTGETPYACEYCPKRFSQLGSVIRHRRIHTGERPYTCSVCGKSFNDKSVLSMHASVHSEERLFTCNICSKSFKSKSSLIKHISQHNEYKPIICDQCGAVFSTKGTLTIHLKRRHSEKSGMCSVCSKHCNDLEVHMRKHTGEEAASCKICNKHFTQSRSLTAHMVKHANTSRFKCEAEGCEKKFRLKHMLEFHLIKYHSQDVPFHCKICNKGCIRKGDLKRHIANHHAGVRE